MTTQEIAERLHELCSQGQNEAAYRELFDNNAVAIEPEKSPGETWTEGLGNLLEKHTQFQNRIAEVHGASISNPLVAGDYISLSMFIDATYKDGSRNKMEELCVYEVKHGKIVTEQFFY